MKKVVFGRERSSLKENKKQDTKQAAANNKIKFNKNQTLQNHPIPWIPNLAKDWPPTLHVPGIK